MLFRQCSKCGSFTEEEQEECANCRSIFSPKNESISDQELIFKVQQGEILGDTIWTQQPFLIYQALGKTPLS